MASPFAKYQSEQVQQIAPGFVEAYGRAGASIGQGIAAVGAGIAARDDRLKEEAKLKGSLAPYLAKDKAKVEAGVKFGSLIKNPDGTVAINPESPNKDMFDTSAIEFYNQTGGDINKMEGTDLTKFAASFESKKKIEAIERETETNKVELDYKRAQTKKLTTDAKLAEWEMGITSTALGAMGFANTPYSASGSVIPSVQGSPAAPGAVVTPNLSSYTGTGNSLDTNGLPTYSADNSFKESLARIDSISKRGSVTGGNFSETAPAAGAKAVVTGGNFSATAAQTREKQLASLIAKAEASEKVAPAPKRVESGETSEDYDAWVAATDEWNKNYGDTHIPTGSPKTARRVELDFNAANPVEKAAPAAAEATEVKTWADAAAIVGESEPLSRYRGERLAGMTPSEYVADWKAAQAAKPDAVPADAAAPALSSALTAGTTPTPAAAAPAAAVDQTPVTTGQFAMAPAAAATPATAPALPSVEQVAAEVQANVQKFTIQRAAIAKTRDEKVNAMTINNEATRAKTTIPIKKSELGNALLSYQNTMVEQVRKFYDSQISDIDSNIKLEESRLTTAKAASAAAKSKADAGRAVAAEGRAVVTAAESKRAAARQVVEESRTDLALYPQSGPFVHIGRQMIVGGKEPSRLGINGLTDAKARSDVAELADGWIKSTDFILGMDDTLSERESMSDQDYFARMRLTTKNLNNWAEGELQQIFGVATFRKAIVSGGNFSDSDRIFVQRAIAYLNSLDPINDKDVYKAQIDALAGFVDNMYRKGLNAYGMKFDPEALERQADALVEDKEPEAAEFIREQAEAGKKFMSRFSIDYKKNKVFDPDAVDAARKILWNALPLKHKIDGNIDDSAPKSK